MWGWALTGIPVPAPSLLPLQGTMERRWDAHMPSIQETHITETWTQFKESFPEEAVLRTVCYTMNYLFILRI